MSERNDKFTVGIIGCGQMGSSLALKLGEVYSLVLCDRSFSKAEAVAAQAKARAVQNLEDVAKEAEIILIAVKPHDAASVSARLRTYLKPTHLIISILAGMSIANLREHFGEVSILRMMPNLAVKYGQGVIGLVDEGVLSSENKRKIDLLCSPLGVLCWLPEAKIDALTALTGSGPAFVFVMFEAMVDAGITMGFSSVQAQQLVLQMMTGSLTLLSETKKHPGELKWQVSSPSGTTIEGLNCLEKAGVRSGIIQTFLAAYNKAKLIKSEIDS